MRGCYEISFSCSFATMWCPVHQACPEQTTVPVTTPSKSREGVYAQFLKNLTMCGPVSSRTQTTHFMLYKTRACCLRNTSTTCVDLYDLLHHNKPLLEVVMQRQLNIYLTETGGLWFPTFFQDTECSDQGPVVLKIIPEQPTCSSNQSKTLKTFFFVCMIWTQF